VSAPDDNGISPHRLERLVGGGDSPDDLPAPGATLPYTRAHGAVRGNCGVRVPRSVTLFPRNDPKWCRRLRMHAQRRIVASLRQAPPITHGRLSRGGQRASFKKPSLSWGERFPWRAVYLPEAKGKSMSFRNVPIIFKIGFLILMLGACAIGGTLFGGIRSTTSPIATGRR